MVQSRTFLPFLVVYLLYLYGTLCKQPPNIIFILADDLGYDDLGYQSQCHQISTPNIDFFYKNGRQLEWMYAQDVCSPTRAALMAGRYPLHTSINTIVSGSWGLPLYFELLPKALKRKLNYSTHAIGKWHLGYYEIEYTPTYRGFETFFGFYGGSENFYNHSAGRLYDFRNDTINNSVVADQYLNHYSTYLYTSEAQNIIQNHDPKQPLFLYLAMQNVHAPCQCPQEYVDEYNTTISNTTRREFAGKLSILDEAVGNITSTLRERNYLKNNTVVIFSSDNGGPVHSAGCGGSNYPLRGEKGSVWEGGTRVTAAFWATDDLFDYNNTLRGMKYNQLMHVVDWYSTLLFAGGIDVYNISNDINVTNLDSINHWNGLIGKYDGDDEYFGIRDNVYYGLEVKLQNISYRKGWLKIFNGTGGQAKFDGWFPPPIGVNIHMEINNDNISINNAPRHIQMYNLSNDPYEYYDINNSTEMNNIAMNLWNEVVELEKTGIPNAKNDRYCPLPQNASYPYDPVVHMNVLAPYCNASEHVSNAK